MMPRSRCKIRERKRRRSGLKSGIGGVSSTVGEKILWRLERMLRFMERSTIHYLKQKGWTNVQIAEFTGHHRNTVAQVLREEVEKKPKTRNRSSAVSVFDSYIADWLDKDVPVARMLELAQADSHHPYIGGETAFYDYVRKVRRARKQTGQDL